MKVLYISNFLNLHQAGLWDEFIKNKVDFTFLSTVFKSNEFNKPILERQYNAFSCDLKDDELKIFLQSFDVIIIGACQDGRILKMLPPNKIYFHNGEHYWKKYYTPLSFAKRVIRMIELRKRYRIIKPYLLCNSSFLSNEFNHFKITHRECFKFGYFPPVNSDELCVEESRENLVLYSGRLLRWKKPLLSLTILNRLIKQIPSFSLTIIGEGRMLRALKRKARQLNLQDHVEFCGFIDHQALINKMKKSSVFVFSSNHEEGWGAVLNESLSCGCIVFASSLAGSTGYLIKNGINGYTFKTKRDLTNAIFSFLSLDVVQKESMRHKAFETINNLWNEKIAANRLANVLFAITNNYPIPKYNEGPMSIN